MKMNFAAVIATGLAVFTTAALAAGASSAGSIVKARHANFELMGKSFKAILTESKKPQPDLGVIRANAQKLDGAASKVDGFFPAGSGPEGGLKTKALPSIWTRNAEFHQAVAKLTSASHTMAAAAASGQIEAVRAAIPALGGSCKGCHDDFRKRD